MDIGRAINWLENKNIEKDLQVISDASKKWTSRKLISGNLLFSNNSDGKGVIEYLLAIKNIVEYQAQCSVKEIPILVNDVKSFINKCYSDESVLKHKSDLQHIYSIRRDMFGHMEQLFKKANKFIQLPELSNNKELDVKDIITDENPGYSPAFNLLSDLLDIKIPEIKPVKNNKSKSISIIFSKSDILELEKIINETRKLLLKIATDDKTEFKLRRLYESLESKDLNESDDDTDEEATSIHYNKMKSNRDYAASQELNFILDEDIVKNVYDFYDHLNRNIVYLTHLCKIIVEMMDKTDSWIRSKNVT